MNRGFVVTLFIESEMTASGITEYIREMSREGMFTDDFYINDLNVMSLGDLHNPLDWECEIYLKEHGLDMYGNPLPGPGSGAD